MILLVIIVLLISLHSCDNAIVSYNKQTTLVNKLQSDLFKLQKSKDSLTIIYPYADFKTLRYKIIDTKKEYKKEYYKLAPLAEKVVLNN